MKILMFGWEFPPHISGGLGTACFGLTHGLVTHGQSVTFVLPKVKGGSAKTHVSLIDAGSVEAPKPDAVHHTMHAWANHMKWLEVDSPLTPYLTPEAYLRETSQFHEGNHWWTSRSGASAGKMDFTGGYGGDLLAEVLRYGLVGESLGATESFDLIHAHDWMAALAGAGAKRSSGKPMVFHIHATEFDRCGDHGDGRIMELERYGLNAADKVIAVSHRTKAIVMEKYGIPGEKIEVVHNAVEKENAVDRDGIPFRFRDKIVLFLGRITMQKGPEYFVDAAKIVLDRWRADKAGWAKDGVPGVRFVMAGSGDLLPLMIDRAAKARIVERFHFTGFLRGADVDRMFATCDLYVLPSVSEPFGITPLEAIKHDVPVILSKQSGVAEIMPHTYQMDFWDVQKMAEQIEYILRNEPVTRRQVELNKEMLDGISWDGAAAEVCAVYNSLVPAA